MSNRRKSRPKGLQDNGTRRRGEYYDPGAKPEPRNAVTTDRAPMGPVQNTRQHRRARARLPFIEQRALAARMGFAVPPELQLTRETGADFWISTWERLYVSSAQPR